MVHLLGGPEFITIPADWVEPRKRFGPEWEGVRYRWNIAQLDAAGEEKLVEDCKLLLQDFYEHPYPKNEVVNEGESPSRFYAGGESLPRGAGSA